MVLVSKALLVRFGEESIDFTEELINGTGEP
jgi:hypothetical protein